eukprot:m.105080 g.105080  ORF g.105080 m.105080 type:complete len:402 (-) comp27619_c0_seq2:113-1318(-)
MRSTFVAYVYPVGCFITATIAGWFACDLYHRTRRGTALQNNLKSKNSTDTDRATAPYLQLMQEIPLLIADSVNSDVHIYPKGRIDHFTFDEERNLLFIACLGDDAVAVVDTFRGRVIHTIHGFNQPQGLVYVPVTNRLYVANAGNGLVDVFHCTHNNHAIQCRKVCSLNFEDEADNLRYADGRVFVGYGEGELGGAIGVILDNPHGLPTLLQGAQLHDNKVNFACPEHPESFQIEHDGARRIFVNVADKNMVVVIDRDAGVEKEQWVLPIDLRGNFAMALDERTRTLFVGVRKPVDRACVLIFDMDTGTVRGRVLTCADMDDLCFDQVRRRLNVIGGSGTVSVIGQCDNPSSCGWRLLTNVSTGVGARTGIWFEARDSLYVAVPASHTSPYPYLGVFQARD